MFTEGDCYAIALSIMIGVFMYNLIVIGGGPAGYEAAIKAAKNGLSVALISDSALGGVCLHSGCIPSKTILHSTQLALDNASFAIFEGESLLDLPVLRERTLAIVQKLERAISQQLKHVDVHHFKALAQILPKRGKLFSVKAGSEIITSEKILIATGSRERNIAIPECEHSKHLTTVKELLKQPTFPQSLVIIGAGSVGLEMATIFNRCGSEVTVIELQDRIAPSFSPDLTKILHHSLSKEGVTIHTNARVVSLHNATVTISTKDNEFSIHASKILPALGRVPNVDLPGIENLSCELTDANSFLVSDTCETTEPNCYAAGDCIGEPMLAHSASFEAEKAMSALLGNTIPQTMLIPKVLYTTPELASVGISEHDAIEQGIEIIVKKRLLGSNGRFLAESSGTDRGICIAVICKNTGVVLGIQLATPNASELISTASLIIHSKLTASDLASIIFPHPTIGEIIKQTIVQE